MFATGDIGWLTQSNTDLEIGEDLKGLVLMSVIFGGPHTHPQYSMKEVSMRLVLL